LMGHEKQLAAAIDKMATAVDKLADKVEEFGRVAPAIQSMASEFRKVQKAAASLKAEQLTLDRALRESSSYRDRLKRP